MSSFNEIFGLRLPEIQVIQDVNIPKEYLKILKRQQWRDRLKQRKFEEYLSFSGPELEVFWKHMKKVHESQQLTYKWQRQWRNLNRNNFKKFKWLI